MAAQSVHDVKVDVVAQFAAEPDGLHLGDHQVGDRRDRHAAYHDVSGDAGNVGCREQADAGTLHDRLAGIIGDIDELDVGEDVFEVIGLHMPMQRLGRDDGEPLRATVPQMDRACGLAFEDAAAEPGDLGHPSPDAALRLGQHIGIVGQVGHRAATYLEFGAHWS